MTKRTLAILCGGRSTRLGSDKGLFQPLGDEPLFARMLRLNAQSFAEVLLVVRDSLQAELYRAAAKKYLYTDEHAKVRVVADDSADATMPGSALTGVATALRASASDEVLCCPVDQLGMRGVHVRALLAGEPITSPRAFVVAGELQPFPSLWAKAHARRVTDRVYHENLGVRATLESLGVATVDGSAFKSELEVNGNTVDAMRAYFGEPLHDPFGRRLHYLRFSLTEACNMACTYCLPNGFPEWFRHKARLGRQDIDVMLAGFRRLGFRKVRFTGGEPTVHPHALHAVRRARELGFETIAMTTNGLLIKDLGAWIDAGLTQLNVSLDSLDPVRFEAVTGNRNGASVRKLIEDAADRGLPVKVNTVLLRSKNGDRETIESLIDWALQRPITLRFIELMETKLNGSFSGSERVLGTEIEPYLTARGLVREALDKRAPDLRGPATDYSSPTWQGRIGLINPMSCNFCSKCNRLRITARGRLKLCLFGDADLALDLSSPDAVALNVRRLIDRKPERHHLEDGKVGNVATFRTIGG